MRAQQTSYQLFTLTPQEKLVMTGEYQLFTLTPHMMKNDSPTIVGGNNDQF